MPSGLSSSAAAIFFRPRDPPTVIFEAQYRNYKLTGYNTHVRDGRLCTGPCRWAGMNLRRKRVARLLASAGLCTALSGCFGVPDLSSPGVVAAGPDGATDRATAVAEMRAEAAAGDRLPYPDAFQAEQTKRLAAREEPLTAQEVEAIQTELALIAERRATTTDDARDRGARDAGARTQAARPALGHRAGAAIEGFRVSVGPARGRAERADGSRSWRWTISTGSGGCRPTSSRR